MRKMKILVKQIEVQHRSRLVEVTIYVPEGVPDEAAMDFSLKMVDIGEASVRNPTPYSEWKDDAEHLEAVEIMEEVNV